MSEIGEDEARKPTLVYIAKLETRIGVMELALRTAARRFSMMGGSGFINGVDPLVGYHECLLAIAPEREENSDST